MLKKMEWSEKQFNRAVVAQMSGCGWDGGPS